MMQPAGGYPVQQQQQMQPQLIAPGSYDFGAFMQKIQQLLAMRGADGNPLVDAPYLNSVSVRVGQAFGATVQAITDLAQNQAMIDHAISIMVSENRWA
ncbi:hypothetical protein P106B_53 [Rhizobium phage vB_RglS_P106B]|uniref:Uncharacterized protein n=1 Tax=Rhizobium phage vB_RglS_P106B TaxID=1458697 RepID=W6EKH7_9CAUD|nr:hypothetical protein P106B_53 [Rhizobium phage vB_RglS_P106B]AHJ10736.1 hypothetical protein P106B_53 [Rhizobium phage vB_RglS_P106B]